jgi:hypothetical protein
MGGGKLCNVELKVATFIPPCRQNNLIFVHGRVNGIRSHYSRVLIQYLPTFLLINWILFSVFSVFCTSSMYYFLFFISFSLCLIVMFLFQYLVFIFH